MVGIKDLDFHRSRDQGCRYDLILVARREVYDEVFDKLQVRSFVARGKMDRLVKRKKIDIRRVRRSRQEREG